MNEFIKIDLKLENDNHLYLDRNYLKPYIEELLRFLDGQDYMNNLTFAKKMLMYQDIKTNNNIKEELYNIDKARKKYNNTFLEDKKRIINLYNGYQYILDKKKIDKEHVKELYDILSFNLLNQYDIRNMDKYYRTKPVYILNGSHLENEPYMGIEANKIDYYMNKFFEYINKEENISEIDIFIKSQIMHFYFVYIHPYLDINGRTSRMISMWYLLNNHCYQYTIFNKAIAFAKRDYYSNIVKTRINGDITLFLKYMLVNVKKELEKEYIIHNIEENINYNLTSNNLQILNYLLSMKGNITVKDLAMFYKNYNNYKKINDIVLENIMPLIDKEIIVKKEYTKGHITKNISNVNIAINSNIIDIDKNKIKYLNLKKIIR